MWIITIYIARLNRMENFSYENYENPLLGLNRWNSKWFVDVTLFTDLPFDISVARFGYKTNFDATHNADKSPFSKWYKTTQLSELWLIVSILVNKEIAASFLSSHFVSFSTLNRIQSVQKILFILFNSYYSI